MRMILAAGAVSWFPQNMSIEAVPVASVLFISLATESLTFIMPSYLMALLLGVCRLFRVNRRLRKVFLNFRRTNFAILLIISYSSYAVNMFKFYGSSFIESPF